MTIIELVVVLIVLGVVVSLLVAPAISGMVARHRVQGVHAELLGDLQLARSEQAQRNGNPQPFRSPSAATPTSPATRSTPSPA